MDAENITRISVDVITGLIEARRIHTIDKTSDERRSSERWPFAGAVEVWLPDEAYGERHLLATLHNLSPNGLAMRTRRPVPNGMRFSLAIHQPELSCYGHGIVRHCTRATVGYLIGVEFIYSDDQATTPPA